MELWDGHIHLVNGDISFSVHNALYQLKMKIKANATNAKLLKMIQRETS